MEEGRGLPCVLVYAVKKDPPPPDTRRHGRENLLHRATKGGIYEIMFIKMYFESILCN